MSLDRATLFVWLAVVLGAVALVVLLSLFLSVNTHGLI
jgi:heme exporter protein D